MKPYETISYKDYTIEIYSDDNPESPRSWDNMGKMVCWHRRYTLGDKHDFSDGDDFKNSIDPDKNLILPLRLYDHSGISMSTSSSYPYNDRWDSGQVGWIYVSKKDLLANYGGKRVTAKLREKGLEHLRNEVSIYDQYLRGDVYGFKVLDKEGNDIDSCWGFYGTDWKTNGLLDHAQPSIDYHIREKLLSHIKKIKVQMLNKVPLQYRQPFA